LLLLVILTSRKGEVIVINPYSVRIPN